MARITILIRLRTDKNYMEKNSEKLHIIAGMTADVDILTGQEIRY